MNSIYRCPNTVDVLGLDFFWFFAVFHVQAKWSVTLKGDDDQACWSPLRCFLLWCLFSVCGVFFFPFMQQHIYIASPVQGWCSQSCNDRFDISFPFSVFEAFQMLSRWLSLIVLWPLVLLQCTSFSALFTNNLCLGEETQVCVAVQVDLRNRLCTVDCTVRVGVCLRQAVFSFEALPL